MQKKLHFGYEQLSTTLADHHQPDYYHDASPTRRNPR
jgi:hypothetical protein